MAMSRKDYEMIARVFNYQHSAYASEPGSRAVLRDTVSRLSKELMADNPRFNPEKFTRACGF